MSTKQITGWYLFFVSEMLPCTAFVIMPFSFSEILKNRTAVPPPLGPVQMSIFS